MRLTMLTLCGSLLLLASSAPAALDLVASDDASNYTNGTEWSGNMGFGFQGWVFRESSGAGYAGHWLATTAATDLNHIWSLPEYKAWGTYANGDGWQDVVAYRAMSPGNSLAEAFDTLHVSIENGPIQVNDPPRRAGFTLRNGNADGSIGAYQTGARLEFRFIGGASNYEIVGSTTNDTGIGWRDSGLHIEVAMTDTNRYRCRIIDAATGSLLTNLVGMLKGTGSIDSIALFNQDTEDSEGHVYFNNLRVYKHRLPTMFLAK